MEKTFVKATVQTMSQDCYDQINGYLNQCGGPAILTGKTPEETTEKILALPYFVSGCYTYIQARAFAEMYHGFIYREDALKSMEIW